MRPPFPPCLCLAMGQAIPNTFQHGNLATWCACRPGALLLQFPRNADLGPSNRKPVFPWPYSHARPRKSERENLHEETRTGNSNRGPGSPSNMYLHSQGIASFSLLQSSERRAPLHGRMARRDATVNRSTSFPGLRALSLSLSLPP